MFQNSVGLSRIISSSINMINYIQKIIPLYNDVKPLITKLNKIKNSFVKTNIKISNIKEEKKPTKKEEQSFNYSSPQFYI